MMDGQEASREGQELEVVYSLKWGTSLNIEFAEPEHAHGQSLHSSICGVLNGGQAESSSKHGSWQAEEPTLPSQRPAMDEAMTKTKRKRPGPKERKRYTDPDYNPIEFWEIEETQLADPAGTRKCISPEEVQLKYGLDCIAKQYVQVFQSLKSLGKLATASAIFKKESDELDPLGIYFAANITLEPVLPRFVLVDFFVRPGYRRKETYMTIGRWIFVNEMSDKAKPREADPFMCEEFCIVVPLTDSPAETEVEFKILRAYGFRLIPTVEVDQLIRPVLEQAALNNGSPLATHYFTLTVRRKWVVWGPTKRTEAQAFGSGLFNEETYLSIKTKCESGPRLPSREVSPVRTRTSACSTSSEQPDIEISFEKDEKQLIWNSPLPATVVFYLGEEQVKFLDCCGVEFPLPADHKIESHVFVWTKLRIGNDDSDRFKEILLASQHMEEVPDGGQSLKWSARLQLLPRHDECACVAVLPCSIRIAILLQKPGNAPIVLATRESQEWKLVK